MLGARPRSGGAFAFLLLYQTKPVGFEIVPVASVSIGGNWLAASTPGLPRRDAGTRTSPTSTPPDATAAEAGYALPSPSLGTHDRAVDHHLSSTAAAISQNDGMFDGRPCTRRSP